MNNRRYFWYFIVFLISIWLGYVIYNGYSLTQIYAFAWPMAVTMFFGAFICGATAEGGGAVAFPVMTLLLSIAPADARVFSLGCQSFGMTSASAFIISHKIPIVWRCVVPVCLAGIIGFLIGDTWITYLISPKATKLFFVSLWVSFGVALFMINKKSDSIKNSDLPLILTTNQIILLCVFGLAGGIVSSVFGNGIDIVTFTLLTLYFRINEKVATPTSIILMSVITVFGFAWHVFVKQDVSTEVEFYLLGAIPVCLSMAPIGALVISKLSRNFIAALLYVVIVSQFLMAIWIIKPDFRNMLFCIAVIAIGTFFFLFISKRAVKQSILPNQ